MKPSALASAFVLCLASAGCTALATASDYDWVKQQDFVFQGIDWQIMDRTAESRLLVRPSIGDMAAAGKLAQDLGVGDATSGWQAAVEAWFKSKGRACQITKTDPVGPQMRQFHYSCRP